MKLIIPPPVQGLGIGLAMWLVHRSLSQFQFTFPGQIYLAGLLILIGVVIEVIAVGAFFRAKTTVNPLKPSQASQLVVSGLYSFSRNPMYLGLGSVLTGWGIWLGNPVNIVLLVSFFAYITVFQIKPEEDSLRQKFGDGYDAYCKRVRRWI